MSQKILLVERDGPVAIVTMNRPNALNALSHSLRAELVRAFASLSADKTVRVAVLTGAGRAFTAGVDLKEAGESGFAVGAVGGEVDLAEGIETFPWPIIGAINGFAITGGFELALMCDILLASENAVFADTHARVGILPGWGLSQRLSRAIGISRAKELSFSGNFLDAKTAERWGLVSRVCAPDELLPTAIQLAHEIASSDSELLREYKRIIDDGFAVSFGQALELEKQRSTDHAANVTAQKMEVARQAVTARGRKLTK